MLNFDLETRTYMINKDLEAIQKRFYLDKKTLVDKARHADHCDKRHLGTSEYMIHIALWN